MNRYLPIAFPAILLFLLLLVPVYFFRAGHAQDAEQFQADKLVVAGNNTRYIYIANVKLFLSQLRKNKTMNAFMQTPWGKDIISSAPLSSFSSVQAALNLFPESFQFEAITLLMPGSLYYASGSAGYVLFFETNNAGKALAESSVLKGKRMAYVQGHLVFASSLALLNAQTEALQAKKINNEIQPNVMQPGALSFFMPERTYTANQPTEETDVFFAAMNTFLPAKYIGTKKVVVSPVQSGIQLEANFEFQKAKADEVWYFYQNGKSEFKHAAAIEKAALGVEVSQDSANIRMFSDASRNLLPIKGEKTSSAFFLNGLNNDFGILLPETALVFNKTDTALISFFSQAFKFNKYKESSVNGGLKFTFTNPYAYYSKNDHYVFEPHLVTQGNYSIWSSTAKSLKAINITGKAGIESFTEIEKPKADEFIFAIFSADLHALASSAQVALKSFEGIYSPQYLADFKEALGKSAKALKSSNLKGISIIGKSHLRTKAQLTL